MAKRRKNSPSPSPSPSPSHVRRLETQMRGLIEAARAPLARRFVTPAKVQERINALLRREVLNVPTGPKLHKASDRKVFKDAVLATDGYRRNAVHHSPVLRSRLPEQVRDLFQGAERALECTRRKTRREVMFALRRTGKGGRKNRRARWTADSRISCRSK